jgi:hypothetical protein
MNHDYQEISMNHDYQEPLLSILVLDFVKPEMTRRCLESIKRHVKFPAKVIYLHNGPAEYAYELFKIGLVDHFIQTRSNNGLGVGTRDLVAACFSRYFMMLQNDQVIARDFEEPEFITLVEDGLDLVAPNGQTVKSISLAGPVGGNGVYSERCHIMETKTYKDMEFDIPLPPGGAGPYSHQMWREEAIQKFYKTCNWTHYTGWRPLVLDQGFYTVRDNPDGGRVRMRTDTKSVRWLELPKEPYVFPEMTAQEWADSIAGKWVPGTIPQSYRSHSFNCWGNIES